MTKSTSTGAIEENVGSSQGARVVRTKPIRVTLDLLPQPYRRLKTFCDETAIELGRASVPSAEVLRALLAQLDSDETLQEAIKEQLQQGPRK